MIRCNLNRPIGIQANNRSSDKPSQGFNIHELILPQKVKHVNDETSLALGVLIKAAAVGNKPEELSAFMRNLFAYFTAEFKKEFN